jgi:Na+/proline symporter
MRQPGLLIRALVGIVIIVVIGALFLCFPLALHWLRDHKIVDVAAMIVGIVFHVWNTYKTRVPYV